MKKPVTRLLILALLLILIASLTCILINIFKKDKPTTEQRLRAMTPEKRAEALIDLSSEWLCSAQSYTLDLVGTVTVTCSDSTVSTVSRTKSIYAGIGTESYAYRSETETTRLRADGETVCTTLEGYQNGSMYLSSDESGAPIRLRSPLPLPDYLAFEKERRSALPTAPISPEHYALVSSTVEANGSYTVTLSCPEKDTVSALGKLLRASTSLPGTDHHALYDFAVTIALARDFTPTAVAIICLFEPLDGYETELLSLRIDMSCSDVNATASPAEPTDLLAFHTVGDLRPLYHLDRAIKAWQTAGQGAYRLVLDRTVSLNQEVYRYRKTDIGVYSRENEKTAYEILSDDELHLYEISYRDGSQRTVIKERATAAVIADSVTDLTENAADAFLAAQLNAAEYSKTRVSSVSADRGEQNTYTLRIANPDISLYEDVIGSQNVSALAMLTVTLADGRLAQSVYRLEIRSAIGNSLSVLHTATCNYYDTLPK